MDQKRDTDNRITSPEQIQQMARGFQSSRIVLTAFELDLFTALDSGPQTSAEIAVKLDTDARATDRLLNALVVL
ncbi:hypothetical protein KKA14_08945, partial [bacterium]|nr:hypothetical protein [bacterium]